MKKHYPLLLLRIPNAFLLISCNTTIDIDDPVLAAPLKDTTILSLGLMVKKRKGIMLGKVFIELLQETESSD